MLKYVLLAFLGLAALFAFISVVFVIVDALSQKRKEDEGELFESPVAMRSAYKKSQYCYMDCENCDVAANCPYSKQEEKAQSALSK